MFMFRGIARRANSKKTPKSWYVKVAERCKLQDVVKVWADLTGYNATFRKFFNVFLKAGDLVFQGLILHRTLEQGFPESLAIGYAYFVCLNGLTCVFNIVSAKNSAFAEILIDSVTEELPGWITDFKQLKFVHIEGKYGSRNLVSLPNDLFSDLPMLTFLHLGNHYHLANIPPFDGTPNLRSLTLAILLSVIDLPPLKNLPRLEALALVQIPQVAAIPDMSSLACLSRLTLYRPNRVCCNGFMGSCNLTDSYCMYDPVFDVPGATCLAENDPRKASPAALRIFARFPHTICQRTPLSLAIEALSDTPTPERIATCAGVLYRQCEIPGVTSANMFGMCYSARMQVVACSVDQPFIQVRRVQIQRGVGLPCDPHEEAWLGCKAKSSGA
ncbi:hypothetical protein KRP22_001394 [Phytophthora ramorum]|nr:hypothetical protein KRP22_7197 [Phytophthora ramorum]